MPKINHLLHRCALSLCLLAALVLSACGPGTGGTGTGPNANSNPTPVTNSYFAGTGAGTVTVAPLPNPSVPAPVCTVSCASGLDTQALSLHVQADRITLSSLCATFTFTGTWSLSANNEATVQGVLESTTVLNGQTSRTSQSASLTLQFTGDADSSASVSVNVKDSTGTLLLNPVTLLRAGNAAPGAAATGC